MSFSSFESINNILFKYDKNPLLLNHIYKLVDDLTNLLNESDYCDVEIKVGEGDDVKTFKAHSNILKARSSYFKAALSNNWVKKSESEIILFEKTNITPKTFEVLLTYLYNGVVNMDNIYPDEILDLLESCDELNLNELIEDIQSYLIAEKKEWIQQNLIYIHGISLKHQPFSLLQSYCNELINENPELLLKSNDIAAIEKSLLITILESDLLKLDEIEIWDYVIQWGVGQSEALGRNISDWNNNDFKQLKNILEDDIIPLIRFDQISSDDFYKKIEPFKKIFNKEVYKGIFGHQSKLSFQKGPRIRKGERGLLNLEMISLISNWIDKKQGLSNEKNIPHNFELILCGSNDGFSRSTFEEKCYDIETVVIMKFKETGELVGGYNPVGWNLKEKSPDENYWIRTDGSFIFKIDGDQLNNSILSKVKMPDLAVFHSKKIIDLTVDDVQFYERLLDFNDLDIRNSINNEPYCFYKYLEYYETNLNIINSNKKVHLLEEFEVYKLVKNQNSFNNVIY